MQDSIVSIVGITKMTEQETRQRSDGEIIERIREIQPQSSPLTEGYFGGFAEAKSRILEILYTAPELRKQANLKLLNEIKNEVKERFQDRTRLGETAANHEDRLADAAYLNALSGLWDWLEAKRRELEK